MKSRMLRSASVRTRARRFLCACAMGWIGARVRWRARRRALGARPRRGAASRLGRRRACASSGGGARARRGRVRSAWVGARARGGRCSCRIALGFGFGFGSGCAFGWWWRWWTWQAAGVGLESRAFGRPRSFVREWVVGSLGGYAVHCTSERVKKAGGRRVGPKVFRAFDL